MKRPFSLKHLVLPHAQAAEPAVHAPAPEATKSSKPAVPPPAPSPSVADTTNASGHVWEVTAVPCPIAAPLSARAPFLSHVRPLLERQLRANPEAAEFQWDIPLLGRIVGRRVSGADAPDAPLALRFVPPSAGGPDADSAPSPADAALPLPDDGLAARGERLVGLSAIAAEVLLELRLRAGNGIGLAEWAQQTRSTLPEPLLFRYRSSAAVFLFEGLAGTGKSVLSRALAERYCREQDVAGVLHELDTGVRGDGTVGDFSARIRAAFAAFHQSAAPAKFLVIDEVDATASRRSDAEQHQEDRAATATLLQLLDALPSRTADHPDGITVVFLTTNRAAALDPALVRRLSASYAFGPLVPEARRALLAAWLADFSERDLQKAVAAAYGMSPADIENALLGAFRAALCQNAAPTPQAVLACLRRHPRTEPV